MPFAQPWNPSRSSTSKGSASRRAATGAGALVATMTPMLVLASPASAHNVCSYHPSDPSTVCLADGTHPTFVPHRYLVVCDRDQDSNRAYARTFRNGVQQPRLEDTTGGQNGCSIYEADVSTLDQFAVCVPTEGCAPPVYKHEF